MKRLLPYALLAYSFTLHAEQDPTIEISASYNNVERAKIKKPSSQRHHHLSYRQGFVLGTYKHKLKSDSELQFGVGYMQTMFDFSHHTKKTSFKQKHFDNLLLQFDASTNEIENWKWDAGLGLQINTDNFSLSRYTFFNGVIHGTVDYTEYSHLHVGVLGFSGMHYTRLLPIIGFDWKINDTWKLNAVFPVDMALVYSINDNWSIDASIRYMLSRQRLNHNSYNSRGLVAYRNWGAEAGINYAFNDSFRINLHVGNAFAGRMRISNQSDSKRKHLELDSSLYYGASASISF